MSDTFEINPIALHQLTLSGTSTFQSRTQEKGDKQIKRAMQLNTITKFHKLCQTVNLNSLMSWSIHTTLILNSRIKQKEQAVQALSVLSDISGPILLDWDFINASPENLTSVFSSLGDWWQLLSYMNLNVTDDALAEFEHDESILRMKHSMEKAGLHTFVAVDTRLILQILLSLIPANINKIAMLQKVLQQHNVTSSQLEFRCSQCMTYFLDADVDEKRAFDSILLILPCFEISPVFFSEIKAVLSRDAPINDLNKSNKSNRLQMRFACSDNNNAQKYHKTYETWLAQQKFTVSMSKHLQLLLYFMHVQTTQINFENYQHLFPGNMLQKCAQVKISNIDVQAVLQIIKSLRVYLHNVDNLLEFRVSCLQGLNRSLRENLSMPQILQLYVICYQHPSIIQECWRQIVSVWNHTTATALQEFKSKHEFEVGAILQTVIHCQVHD